MLRSLLKTTVATAAFALFAVGAKAQFYPYPYSISPYPNIYHSPVVVVGGNLPVAVAPSAPMIRYGALPYLAPFGPLVVNYTPIVPSVVPPVVHYGFYRNTYYRLPRSNRDDSQNDDNRQDDMPNDKAAEQANTSLPANYSIAVRYESAGQIALSWQGDTRNVARITYAVLGANYQILQARTITGPPNHARFMRRHDAAYYQVCVQYLNGTTNTITSPVW